MAEANNTKYIVMIIIGVAGFILMAAGCVIAIAGGLVFTGVQTEMHSAQDEMTRNKLSQVDMSIQTYQVSMGKLPESLDVLVNPPGGKSSFLRADQIKDAWDNDMVYTREGTGYTLLSSGADGIEGTDDDLTL